MPKLDRRKSWACAGVVGLLFSAASPILAHHSISAEFDLARNWSVSGKLARIDWMNPHISVWVDATDPATGKVAAYGCEGNPPQPGITRESERLTGKLEKKL